MYISRHLHEVFKECESYKRGDIPQSLIDAFLAMDTNMLDISGKDELNELAGKSDGGRGGGDLSSKMRQAILERARANGDDVDFEDDLDDEGLWEGPQAGSTASSRSCEATSSSWRTRGTLARFCRAGARRWRCPGTTSPWTTTSARGSSAPRVRPGGTGQRVAALSRAIGDLEYKQSKNLSAKDQVVTAYPEIRECVIEPGDEFMVTVRRHLGRAHVPAVRGLSELDSTPTSSCPRFARSSTSGRWTPRAAASGATT